MTGPVVPTPPAEVDVRAELDARLRDRAWPRAEAIAEDLAPLVERMVAERVRAARDEALREAERRLLTEPDPVRFAARIVAELREEAP